MVLCRFERSEIKNTINVRDAIKNSWKNNEIQDQRNLYTSLIKLDPHKETRFEHRQAFNMMACHSLLDKK